MARRSFIGGANAALVIVAAIGIAIVVNLIAAQAFWRLDLTENQIYTLSEVSKEAVSDLERPVTIKAFVSPEMSPPFHTLPQQLADLFEEYAAAADGDLSYQIISPSDEEAIETDAESYGCQQSAIGQATERERSLRLVYKCIAILQGDRVEVIPDLRTTGNPETDNFEYQITKALLNLQSEEPQTIGFVTGFGGIAGQPGFVEGVASSFEQLYGNLFAVTAVDLTADGARVPEEVDALVILNVDKPFTPNALFAVDQYVQRGGSVGWYQSASGVDQALQQQLAQQLGRQVPGIRRPLEHGLNELFATYGVTHRGDLVLDRENAMTAIPVPTERGWALVSHPLTFQINEIDRSLPFTAQLPPMALSAPSSLAVNPEVIEGEATDVTKILVTSETAVRRTQPPTQLAVGEYLEPTPNEEPGPFVLAVAIEGDVPSYYEAQPLPQGVEESALVSGSAPARLLVVGSGDFYRPNPESGYGEQLAGMGGQFLLASLEWLAQDTKLTAVRSKTMPRLVGEVAGEKRRAIRYVNIVLVPAAFGLIGLFMRHRRKRRIRNARP